ncbi:dihydrofolate reductase [Paucibacter sp. APW11]|uniref:Dihydrofolate reductase n=1 Tax=Roseateles aquae TaxID=3077235 RepID=A0ABU3P803_9BURK|nr:dihydrofolate reductase [Paucibacter sp. APW11]MDT8998701.1 dihydrofolate reductase [Paucibacter sp. APW11]
MTQLTLIAGVAGGGAIGRGNELLVRLPEDMAHFKALTLNHSVIMGRKTWDSIPPRFRPLVQRRNLVLSRQSGLQLDGAEVFASLDQALAACTGEDEVFVIGGAEIYAQALPRADRLELTEFELSVDADAFFPLWSAGDFAEQSRQTHQASLPDGRRLTYHFVRYQRRR